SAVLQLRQGGRSDRGAQPGSGTQGAAPLERAALVLAHAAPDTAVLAGFQGPLTAGGAYGAATAYFLGFFDLNQCRARIADREEELGVFVTAGSVVAPVHAGHSSR